MYQYYNMQVFDWNSWNNTAYKIRSRYQYYNMQVFDWNLYSFFYMRINWYQYYNMQVFDWN